MGCFWRNFTPCSAWHPQEKQDKPSQKPTFESGSFCRPSFNHPIAELKSFLCTCNVYSIQEVKFLPRWGLICYHHQQKIEKSHQAWKLDVAVISMLRKQLMISLPGGERKKKKRERKQQRLMTLLHFQIKILVSKYWPDLTIGLFVF